MTPQEMQALEGFLAQLTQARAGAKDPQAEALIADAVARQPDAAYLLVQRAILLDHALIAAKAQISTLQAQLQMAQASGSSRFLAQENAWGSSANAVNNFGNVGNVGNVDPAAARPVMPAPSGMPVSVSPPAQPVQVQAQPPRPGFLGGGLGSTLGGIATTAAGVAGGAFLFQGIENLFHRNSGNGSGSGFLGQPAAGALPAESTVVNNYYGNDDRSSGDALDAGLSRGLPDDGAGSDDFLDDDIFNA
ncbi:DUF2076 domain-containing protein [Cupriavidus sp. 2TAF22]|uniref:DUF2076 domain-containing protein n=1 Tax=unclassified Cupriavidus TaxID=2640874 RepID=UPI003F9163BC